MTYLRVEVRWHDAKSTGLEWTAIEELRKERPASVLTNGTLIAKNQECLIINQNIVGSENDAEGGPIIVIPIGWIKEIWVVKDVEKTDLNSIPDF